MPETGGEEFPISVIVPMPKLALPTKLGSDFFIVNPSRFSPAIERLNKPFSVLSSTMTSTPFAMSPTMLAVTLNAVPFAAGTVTEAETALLLPSFVVRMLVM